MNARYEEYESINFRRRARWGWRAIPFRPLTVALIVAGFAGLWWLAPRELAFWVLTPVVLVLAWAATYGWRPALRMVRSWLDRLDRLGG